MILSRNRVKLSLINLNPIKLFFQFNSVVLSIFFKKVVRDGRKCLKFLSCDLDLSLRGRRCLTSKYWSSFRFIWPFVSRLTGQICRKSGTVIVLGGFVFLSYKTQEKWQMLTPVLKIIEQKAFLWETWIKTRHSNYSHVRFSGFSLLGAEECKKGMLSNAR